MKNTAVILMFCLIGLPNSAGGQSQKLKDSLSISQFVKINQSAKFKTFEVKFKKVVNDSRCPKHVICNRAGEAFVEVSVYKNGELIQEKKLRIDASGYVIDANNLAFHTENIKIYGLNLTPYPQTKKMQLTDKDYELEILFKPQL